MIVNVIMPTLFSGLARRAVSTILDHGAGSHVTIAPVIVGNDPHVAAIEHATFINEAVPQGVNAAIRSAVPHCQGDFTLVACDDVQFTPGWLKPVLEQHDRIAQFMADRPFAIGLRYGPIQRVGTVYGKMYGNLPFFRSDLFGIDAVRRHFMPEYLHGQWGDAAFGMGLWAAGGAVFDSRSPVLVTWADRMGYPQARPNREMFDEDMAAFKAQWKSLFGKGWGDEFRDFNVDCPIGMLGGDTINIPHPAVFQKTLGAHL